MKHFSSYKAMVCLSSVVVYLAMTPLTLEGTELHEGLVAYWPLDSGAGSVVTDEFGATMDQGELINGPEWLSNANAKFGSALQFDGFEQNVQLSPSNDLDIGTNAVSLSAWVNVDIRPSELTESFGGIFDSNGDNYVLYLDKNNQELRFKVTDEDGTAERPGIPESQLTPNEWGHVLGVYNGDANTAKVYFNGALVDSRTNPNLNGMVLPGQIASIGANTTINPDVPFSRFFPGAIDDVAVWNRPLGLAEATYLYNEGVGNAVGAGSPDIQFISDEVVVTPVAPTVEPIVYLGFEDNLNNSGTGGTQFDAVHLDEPDINDALFTPGRTGQALDLRENPVSNPLEGDGLVIDYEMSDSGTVIFDYTAGEYYNFQSLWTNSVGANDWEMWIYNDGRVRGRVDGNSFVEFNLDNLSGLNEPHQIAFTWERGTEDSSNVAVTLFVDGEQRDQDIEGNWVDPGESIFIGGGDDANHYGNGIWDEFKIYDTALTPGEVLFLFSEIESACDPNSNGDLDGNGTVEFADFLVLSQNFGQMVGSHTEGDIDCNGTVEFSDFLVLSNNFGNQVNRLQTVPEPTGYLPLLVAALFGSRIRRRRSTSGIQE